MKDYADDGNLHARIYAMRSRLLTLADYAALVRDREAFLDEKAGGRGYIEAKENIFTEQIAAILHLAEAATKYAPLFLAFLRQYEARNAKLLLTKAFGRQVHEQWYDIGPYTTLDKSLLGDELLLDGVRRLLAAMYGDDAFLHERGCERLEMRIDMHAAGMLQDASASFGTGAKKVFDAFTGRRVAVIALIWRRRLGENYRWDDGRIEGQLALMSGIFETDPRPQMKIVEETLDRRFEEQHRNGRMTPGLMDMEYHLEEYYYRWVRSQFHRDFHSVYCVVAYLWLLYYQVRNLFRVIEGMRFSLPPGEIMERIIGEA